MFNKKSFKSFKISGFRSAIAISIVISIFLTGFLMNVESTKENYTTLGIRPESYDNFPSGKNTSFVYEVKSYEKENRDYFLEIYLNDNLVNKKTFSLKPGEVFESRENINIEQISFPSKVVVNLNSPTKEYSVHYWLKKR